MFSANYILKICILLSVLIYYTEGSKDQSEEKKVNIQIGFDLTQGENGAPSLKIRDLEKESPEIHRRASDSKDRLSVRADSFSENSAENVEKNTKDSSKEHPIGRQESKSRDSSDDDSDEKVGISTRGMESGDYGGEPEAARLGNAKPAAYSKESKSSSAEESAYGGDEKDNARRNNDGARRHGDGHLRAKRNAPNLKGLMENIRKRSK